VIVQPRLETSFVDRNVPSIHTGPGPRVAATHRSAKGVAAASHADAYRAPTDGVFGKIKHANQAVQNQNGIGEGWRLLVSSWAVFGDRLCQAC